MLIGAARRSAIITSTALIGCSPQAELRFAGFPPVAGAHSLLVGSLNGGLHDVVALDLDDPASAVSLGPFARSDGAVLEALAFPEQLNDLGVDPGNQILDPSNTTDTLSSRRQGAYDLSVDDRSSVWMSVQPNADWIRVRTLNRPCKPLTIHSYTLSTFFDPGQFLAAVTSSLAIAATGSSFWLIGSGEPEPLSFHGPSFFSFAGAADEKSELWFTSGLNLIHGTLDLPHHTISATVVASFSAYVSYVAAHQAPNGPEVYTLSQGGPVQFFDGHSLTQVYAFPPSSDPDWSGGVAAVGDGEAVAVSASSPLVVRIRNGIATEEPMTNLGTPRCVAQTKVGTVIGNSHGQVFKNEGSAWTALDTSIALFVFAVAGYQDGVAFGGPMGYAGIDLPASNSAGVCSVVRLGYGDIHAIAAAGDAVVAFRRVENGNDGVVVMRPN